MSNDDYEVGYKRPPKKHRFKPGQSGNLRGRPKQKPSLAALLSQTLYGSVTVKVGGMPRRMPRIEAIVHTVMHKAIAGDARARRDLMELLKRYPATVSERPSLRVIDKSMTPKEAADAYRETLTAICGMTEIDEGFDV